MTNENASNVAKLCRVEAHLTDCPDERDALLSLARAIESANAASVWRDMRPPGRRPGTSTTQ